MVGYGRQDLSYLNALDSDFHGTGASTTDYENRLVAGHPPGGVAILWHRKLEQYVKPVELGLDWCAAIEVSVGHRRFYIINVYMPYQCPENEEKARDFPFHTGPQRRKPNKDENYRTARQ